MRKSSKILNFVATVVLALVIFCCLCSFIACFLPVPKRIGTCFLDLKAEWTCDELTIETTGESGHDYIVFGKISLYGEEIEVGGFYYYAQSYMIVYSRSDIEAAGKNENGKYRSPDKSKQLFYLGCDEVKFCRFSKNIKEVNLKVGFDKYSETAGQESRVGETWVLTRKDLS